MSTSIDMQARIVRSRTVGALVANVALSIAKMAGGVYGSSQALVADAVHSLSDCVTDVAILFGVRMWSKPPDEDHPYGHERIETVVTVGIGLAIVAAAVGMGYDALQAIITGQKSSPNVWALTAGLVSIGVKEAMYQWTVAAARQVKSSALYANAWHHRTDAISSIPASLAVGLAMFDERLAFVDSIGALLVTLFVAYAGFRILTPALGQLTDQGASKSDCDHIAEIAQGVEGVREVHNVRSRYLGLGLIVDLHVLVDGHMPVSDGHDVAEAVKACLLERGPSVVDVVVHIEPFETESAAVTDKL